MSVPDIIAIPRDPNPYQELLYSQLRARGHRVRYAGELTPSRTVNLVLLPLELACLACRGYRIFHIHWTFWFLFTGADRSFPIRRASRLWFGFVLRSARRLRLRIVWTAHNVLPHGQIFDDDLRARRTLIGYADLVIAHSRRALDEIRSTLAEPRLGKVFPHGPLAPAAVAQLEPPRPSSPRRILFLGRVEEYKGVEDLIEAAREPQSAVQIHVAGLCRDTKLRARLADAASTSEWVTLSLDHVPEEQLASLFKSSVAVIYPFRAGTTSGSVTLGLAAGRAVVVPDLAVFADLPCDAVIRYQPGVDGLRGALEQIAAMPAETLIAKGKAARVAASSCSWEEIAELTSVAFDRLCRARDPDDR